jgi:DNA-binding XRE family transcriptional regulator
MNGAELQAWREVRGMTRRQLAADLGVHYQTIVKWENDDRRLSPLLWRALEHLDCTTRRPPPSERE